jgi:ribosomal protein L7/L12
MRTRSELAVECKGRRAHGASDEDLMAFLRAEGCSKIDTILVLREIQDLSLGKAKELVHLSRTWADVREKDDTFHEALVDAVDRDPRFAHRTD